MRSTPIRLQEVNYQGYIILFSKKLTKIRKRLKVYFNNTSPLETDKHFLQKALGEAHRHFYTPKLRFTNSLSSTKSLVIDETSKQQQRCSVKNINIKDRK